MKLIIITQYSLSKAVPCLGYGIMAPNKERRDNACAHQIDLDAAMTMLVDNMFELSYS